jgi:uncharacterized protein YyaL (SSP411 family)
MFSLSTTSAEGIAAFAAAALLLSSLALASAQDPLHIPNSDMTQDQTTKQANHLEGQTSPYLLQHLYNPVDWYPWGPEALQRAKDEDKPILVSIGYSACHWCHVMEHESFEDAEVAKLMNRWFVCIKVDREERSDIDQVYMAAVQRMTGQGGWPLNCFLTPELKPFYGGTYYPPRSGYGRPSWTEVLKQIHAMWTDNRESLESAGTRLTSDLERQNEPRVGSLPGAELLPQAVENSRQTFDPIHGGFSQPDQYAPKFPHSTEMLYLLRYAERAGDPRAAAMVDQSLENMARGGIHDQIGGGFARYTVDRAWLVPHFEKMLYDNSQLARVYIEAWQATGKEYWREVATKIFDYVLREMTSAEGGFYSATDADSEGVEGKFFVWSLDEIKAICGADADVAIAWYGVTKHGNWEETNILTQYESLADFCEKRKLDPIETAVSIERARSALYAHRKTRIHPLLDDKVLSAWNGLMLSAFARGGMALGEERYLDAARKNAAFLLEHMRAEDGRMMRTRRNGVTHLAGYLEDHAFVTEGLLDLYEATLEVEWLEAALELADLTDAHFADVEHGAWFKTAHDHEDLLVRFSTATESSLPSGAGVAAMNAARLGYLTGDPERINSARDAIKRHGQAIAAYPTAFCQFLLLHDFLEAKPAELYFVGSKSDPVLMKELERWRTIWPPYRVLTVVEEGERERLTRLLPAIEGKTARDGKPTLYICHEGICEAPEVLSE